MSSFSDTKLVSILAKKFLDLIFWQFLVFKMVFYFIFIGKVIPSEFPLNIPFWVEVGHLLRKGEVREVFCLRRPTSAASWLPKLSFDSFFMTRKKEARSSPPGSTVFQWYICIYTYIYVYVYIYVFIYAYLVYFWV